MALGKFGFSVVCGVVVGILAWVTSWKGEFTLRNEMIVARPAHEVYELITDLRNHIKYHEHVPKEIELLHTVTSEDDVELRTFEVKSSVPLLFGFHVPVTFDALTKLTKYHSLTLSQVFEVQPRISQAQLYLSYRPNKEFVVELDVGLGTKGSSTWTLEHNKVTAGEGPSSGTLVGEEFTLECMWIMCGFVEENARSSHEELFRNLKRDLEGKKHV